MSVKNLGRLNAGFTLIELLVVIVIIGVLMGLMFPGVRMVQKRALDMEGTQLCIQTATAWDVVLVTYRRFPSEALIKACSDGASQAEGDLRFAMNTPATSLLNWWEKVTEDPRYDSANYKYKKNQFNYAWDNINEWPVDNRLERSGLQMRWGLVAPWAKRHVEDADEGDPSVARIVEAATVNVILDTNGDNVIRVPPELGKVALDSEGNPLELKKSAIA